ncbi:MAG: thioredoxin domain-containing protein [Bifidobacteriaceae bacterium]|jgi:protein-disulfide isomerase|nr:thioredoxin domain-containing protein [Bifidobacteriaceae bacterium]
MATPPNDDHDHWPRLTATAPTGDSTADAKGLAIEEIIRRRARQTRRRLVIAAAAAAVLLAAGTAAVILTRESVQPARADQPPGAQADGGILIGQDLTPGGPAPGSDEAVTVEVISDFLCPWCRLLEQAHGQALADKARAGEIRLVIHPVNNANLADLNDHYSWRAMLAADTVAALEPGKLWAFHAALWENQPEESAKGDELTDQRIAALAVEAGVSQEVADQLADSPVAEWARWSSDQALRRVGGTPVMLMSFADSEPQEWNNWLLQSTDESGETRYAAGDLDQAIANVRSGKAPDAE